MSLYSLCFPLLISLCIAPAGRPGSRVFPHQQYPCWCRPKGEALEKDNFLTLCFHNVHAVCPPPQHSVSYSHRDTPGRIWWDCHVRHVTHAVISQVYSIDRLSDLGLSVELSLLSFSLTYQIHQGHLQNINMKYLTHQYLYKPGWVRLQVVSETLVF